MPTLFRAALVASLSLAAASHAAVVHSEIIQGDLSNDQSMPTTLALSSGSNIVSGSVSGADFQDWFTVTVPAGYQWNALTLLHYAGIDEVAFIGFQDRSVFSGSAFSASSYNGYGHFGPAQVNTDLLPYLGDQMAHPGSIGFSTPLPAGDYSFLVQQFGDDTQYTLDFNLSPIPTPATLALATLGLATLTRRRR